MIGEEMSKTGDAGRAVDRKQARVTRLLDEVTRQKSLHVRDAAELLDVSEMTVRRDVRNNENFFQFLGGHIMAADGSAQRTPYDLTEASERNEAAKKAACAACVPLIREKDTIFVDCGTTLPHLVGMIPVDMEVTLICYALNIADMAVRKPNIRLVVIGGTYHPPTASFYPLDEDATLAQFAIGHAFISAAGVDADLGATCTTFREAGLKRAAMARARSSVLVVDRSKIGQIKSACIADLAEFDVILTEKGEMTRDAVAKHQARRVGRA